MAVYGDTNLGQGIWAFNWKKTRSHSKIIKRKYHETNCVRNVLSKQKIPAENSKRRQVKLARECSTGTNIKHKISRTFVEFPISVVLKNT